MTPQNLSQAPIAKPGRPWEPSRKEKGGKLVNLLLAIAIALLLYFFTGLNGKLGFFIAFLSWLERSTGEPEFQRRKTVFLRQFRDLL